MAHFEAASSSGAPCDFRGPQLVALFPAISISFFSTGSLALPAAAAEGEDFLHPEKARAVASRTGRSFRIRCFYVRAVLTASRDAAPGYWFRCTRGAGQLRDLPG